MATKLNFLFKKKYQKKKNFEKKKGENLGWLRPPPLHLGGGRATPIRPQKKMNPISETATTYRNEPNFNVGKLTTKYIF